MAVEVITTVLIAATAQSPASPYDLTDLATVHDEFALPTNVTGEDTFLQRAITQSSKAIAKYCNRVFPVEAVQDQIYIQRDNYPWQNPAMIYPVQLSRWPLVNAQAANFTGNLDGTVNVTGLSSTAGITAGALIFAADGSIPQATTVVSVDVGTSSLVLSNAATSTETGATLFTGIQVVQTLAAGDTDLLVYGTDFTVDPAKGWLIRLDEWSGTSEAWEARPLTVQYQAGYSPIPDDLAEAALRLVTMRYRGKGRDPMQMERTQPGLGTERFWTGSAPKQTGAFPPEIEALIDNYRVPVVG